MRCPIETQETSELLLAYCARKLDPGTAATLERHMASCPACRELYEGQRAVWAALDAWDDLPVPAVHARDGVFVGVNARFLELTGWAPDEVLGKRPVDLLPRLVAPRDHATIERLSKSRQAAELQPEGMLWCNVIARTGEERPMRVQWRLAEDGRDVVTVLVDARPEAFGQALGVLGAGKGQGSARDRQRGLDGGELVVHGATARATDVPGRPEGTARIGP
jgi:PAS domain S-box-containing protein